MGVVGVFDFYVNIPTALKGWVGHAPQGRGALHINCILGQQGAGALHINCRLGQRGAGVLHINCILGQQGAGALHII